MKLKKQIELAKLKQYFGFALEDKIRKHGMPILDSQLNDFLQSLKNEDIFEDFKIAWKASQKCPHSISQRQAFKQINELKALTKDNIEKISKLLNKSVYEAYFYDKTVRRFKLKSLVSFEEWQNMQEIACLNNCLDKVMPYLIDLLEQKKTSYFFTKADAETFIQSLHE